MSSPLVLHLNGPPGVGKSTLARRWADAHPGTLLLDPDVLRTWVSGWRDDFVGVGPAIWPTSLAMVTAYAGEGRDVVVPQLLADPTAVTALEQATAAAGAELVEVFVESDDLAARFGARPRDEPWLEAVHALVEEAGPGHLEDYVDRLRELVGRRSDAIRLRTVEGEVDAAYDALVAAVTARRRSAGRRTAGG